MSLLTCRFPWAPTPVNMPFVRCGRCKGCRLSRILEWRNRLMLEQSQRTDRPLYFTLTYNHWVDEDEAIDCQQRFLKRWRKAGYTIRYLISVERGKRGSKRLHHHGIAWCHPAPPADEKIHEWLADLWQEGFVDKRAALVRTKRAFGYCAKYCVKEGRYSYSKRPQLGAAGLAVWRDYVMRSYHAGHWRTASECPGLLNSTVLGERAQIHIPERDVLRTLDDLGVQYAPEIVTPLLSGVPNGPLNADYLRARIRGEA